MKKNKVARLTNISEMALWNSDQCSKPVYYARFQTGSWEEEFERIVRCGNNVKKILFFNTQYNYALLSGDLYVFLVK